MSLAKALVDRAMMNAENRREAVRVSRLAAVAVVCLMARVAGAEPTFRAAVVDARYQTPHGMILRGHAGDAGGIADLLEDLGRAPGTEEPILREMSRSGRGYEYTIIVPSGPEPGEDFPRRDDSPEPPHFFADEWIGKGLNWLFSSPPGDDSLPEEGRRPVGFSVERGRDTVPTAGKDPFAGLSIDDITVNAIYMTSVGGVVEARAHGRRFLMRDGDQLADGDLQGIGFVGPAVAWVRFRQRDDSNPGFPYRPVVWLLTARDNGTRTAKRQEPGGGQAIGGTGSPAVEVRRLGTEDINQDSWTWELTVEQAPRFAIEIMGGPAKAFGTLFDLLRGERDDPGDWITVRAGFGTIEIPWTSHDSIVGAIAAELGIPPPHPPNPPARRPPGPRRPVPEDPPSQDVPGVIDMDSGFPFYDSADRRDPFLDLSDTSAQEPPEGPRPSGVPGLLIDEIEVTGLFMTPAGAVAEIRAPRNFFFVLSEGDQLYDGDVLRIDPRQGVTFHQFENDPTALKPFRRVVKTVDPRWIGDAGALRDPFRSLQDGGATLERSPSALAGLTCSSLNDHEAGRVAALLEHADRRLARYWWERRLVAGSGNERGPWERRFLDDIAKAASPDLARVFSSPFAFGPGVPLQTGPAPPPAEMFALLGDYELIAGRLRAAAAAYRLAEELHPGQRTRCGHLFDGKLYGAENYLISSRNSTHWYRLTGFLLAWNLASGRVAERHLLPTIPVSLAVEKEELQIALEGGGTARITGPGHSLQGGVLPDPLHRNGVYFDRFQEIKSGALLAMNFEVLSRPGCSWEVRRSFDERLPLDLPELEKTSRAAAERDPTRPWHPFFLGQALWAQGRRNEAETVWRGLWGGHRWTASYRELVWMAMFHERCGQSGWADRVFEMALARRRRLSRVTRSHVIERLFMTTLRVWSGLRDPERRYLWWRRMREMTGTAPGDAFRAVLWADERRRKGDGPHARDELSFVKRARLSPRDGTLQSAWLDYTFYGVVACAAMLFAGSAVLGRRMIRSLQRRRIRWPGWRQAARPLLDVPAALLLAAALLIALSLGALAISHLDYLVSLPEEPEDSVAARTGPPGDEDRFLLGSSDLLYAWLTTGVLPPEQGEPLPLLLQKVREIRSLGAGVQGLLGLAGSAAMLVLALPAALFLSWRRARDVLTRWVPGAAQVRAGARLQGYAVFGLFVFAIVPLAWLVIARTSGPVPAPGPVSAYFFDRGGAPRLFLPLSDGDLPGESNPERFRSRLFFRLLAVYPRAGLFWTLVGSALALSLTVHITGRIVNPRE